MHDADLPAAYVLRIQLVQDVIPVNVRIKTGVKTENVRFLKKLHIVMNAVKNAGRDCSFK